MICQHGGKVDQLRRCRATTRAGNRCRALVVGHGSEGPEGAYCRQHVAAYADFHLGIGPAPRRALPGVTQAAMKRITLDRVILALHLLGDDEGLTCTARYPEIARACLLSLGTIIEHLGTLAYHERVAHFRVFDYHVARPTTVFLDHPRGLETALELEALRRRPWVLGGDTIPSWVPEGAWIITH